MAIGQRNGLHIAAGLLCQTIKWMVVEFCLLPLLSYGTLVAELLLPFAVRSIQDTHGENVVGCVFLVFPTLALQ